MSVPYTYPVLNARLSAVVDTVGLYGNGNLIIREGTAPLANFQLAGPCGTVDGGVLTFSGQLFDPGAVGTGLANNAVIQDALGTTIVSGITVTSSGGATKGDIILFNGLNNTQITAGQVIEIASATITGA